MSAAECRWPRHPALGGLLQHGGRDPPRRRGRRRRIPGDVHAERGSVGIVRPRLALVAFALSAACSGSGGNTTGLSPLASTVRGTWIGPDAETGGTISLILSQLGTTVTGLAIRNYDNKEFGSGPDSLSVSGTATDSLRIILIYTTPPNDTSFLVASHCTAARGCAPDQLRGYWRSRSFSAPRSQQFVKQP